MITIFHAPRTRAIRVIWTCEELELPYRIEPVDFSVAYRATPEWRAMNPVGKVPVLLDDRGNEGKPFRLFESGAMVQYLLDRYGEGRLQPEAGTESHALYLQWSWFAESTFARPLGEIVNHRRAFAEAQQSQAAIDEMIGRAWLCVEALDAELASREWLVDDTFTAADIMTGYSLMLADWLIDQPFPKHVADYFARLEARPGYVTATR